MTHARDVGRLVRLVRLVTLAFLVGAAAFGLWHVVVGGLVNGNPRAAGFGVVLATAASGLLAVEIVLLRRRANR